MARQDFAGTTVRLARRVVIAAAFAAVVAVLFHLFAQDFPVALRFEHQLADWRTGLLSDRRAAQHPGIAVVLVNDDTLKGLPYTSPVDRGILARLVERLDATGVKAIGLDFLFERPTEPAKDEALRQAIRAAMVPVILAGADERAVGLSDEERDYQRDFIAATGRPAGYVNLDEDRDDVVRRRLAPVPGGDFPRSFAALIAAVDGKVDDHPDGRMAWLRRPVNNADTFFTVTGTLVLADNAVGTAVRSQLKGRLVLVGGGFPDRDLHRTPLFAHDGELGSNKVHGVVLHAQALAQILDQRSVVELADWPVVLLLSFLGFTLGVNFHQRGFNWITGVLSTGLLIGLDLLLFWKLRWIVPYLAASTAWFAGAFSGYVAGRLIAVTSGRGLKADTQAGVRKP